VALTVNDIANTATRNFNVNPGISCFSTI